MPRPALQRYGLTDAFAKPLHLTASRPLQKRVPSDMVACRSEFGHDDVRREHLRHHPTRYTARPSHSRSAVSESSSARALGSRACSVKRRAASTRRSTG